MAKSIKEFKNIEELSKMCVESDEPNIIVKDDSGGFVVMTLAEYDKRQYDKELEQGLKRAEEDIKNGRYEDFDTLFDELEARYGNVKV